MSGTDYTTTPTLGLFKPNYDMDAEQWGAHLNSNADMLDAYLSPGGNPAFVPTIGGTMTGLLVLSGDPSAALGAASKQYVDGAVNRAGGPFVPIGGATMTGALTLSADPSAAMQPVTLQYFNAKAGSGGPFLPLATGGTVAGATTFSASGTGLAVTNNATVGGSITCPVLILTPTVNFSWVSPSIVASQPFASQSISAGRNLTITPATAAIVPALNGVVGQLSGTVSGASDVYRLSVGNDNMAGSAVADGTVKTLGIYHTVNGAAVAQGRALLWAQLNVNNGPTTSGLEMQGSSFQVFCNQTNPAVLPYCQPLCAAGGVSAGAYAGSFMNEIDYYAYAGSSVGAKVGLLIALSTNDKVRGSGLDAGLVFSNANTSTNASPGMLSVISIGNGNHGFPAGTTDGSILNVLPQTAYKSAGRTVQMIPTQCLNGINLLPVYFTGSAFASSGFNVDGSGQVRSGNMLISRSGTGVSVDVDRQVVTAVAIAVGGVGTGAGTNDFYVGDTVSDAYGGLYTVASVNAGKITGLTICTPATAASPPVNPVAISGGSGVGATVNLTWIVRNTLALNPSGGATTFGGPVTLPAGSTGAFLPLTGGTVTGASTFSAAGTALTVTNNASVGGTLTVSGTLAVNGNATFGSGAQNILTVVPGAASGNAIALGVSGTGGVFIGAGGNAALTAGPGVFNAAVTVGGALTTSGTNLIQAGSTAASNNLIRLVPGGPGVAPQLTLVGVDANPILNLVAQGTGGFQFNSRVGFNSTAPIAKPTVSGAKGSNAALASLLAALVSYGLVTDTTTA